MITTPAWRDLNGNARAAYVEISNRYGGPNSNNGRIPYSSRELAQNLNISKRTALRIFHTLQAHGFLVMTRRGRYGRKRTYASEWRLTEIRCDVTGEAPAHAYRHWQGSARPISNRDFVDRSKSGAAA